MRNRNKFILKEGAMETLVTSYRVLQLINKTTHVQKVADIFS